MNNRLKFRIYVPDHKRFEYFDLNNFEFSDLSKFHYSDRTLHSKEYPIQQYTGLNDKNSNLIYEGDIIRGMFDFGPAGFKEEILPVNWHNEKGYQWEYWELTTIEVVGNIFQYPCKPDHNGECIICDCWLIDCPFIKKNE